MRLPLPQLKAGCSDQTLKQTREPSGLGSGEVKSRWAKDNWLTHVQLSNLAYGALPLWRKAAVDISNGGFHLYY
jgi:hypothetical protein